MQEKPQPAATRLGRFYFLSFVKRLAFDDFARLDAAGADANALASARDLGFDGLDRKSVV